MRPDCHYEIVSTSERMVGCERKRTLRKQHRSDSTLGTVLLSPMHQDTRAVGSSSMLSTGGSALPTHPYSMAIRQMAPGEWDWQGLMHPSSQLQMDNRVESTHSECSSLSTQPSSCHAATPDDASAFSLPWSGLPQPADGERLAVGTSPSWQPTASDLQASEASTAMAYAFDFGGDTLLQPDSASKAGVVDGDCAPTNDLWRAGDRHLQLDNGSVFGPLHL